MRERVTSGCVYSRDETLKQVFKLTTTKPVCRGRHERYFVKKKERKDGRKSKAAGGVLTMVDSPLLTAS